MRTLCGIILRMERPLVSFCLLFYNHRRWFGAALEAAFAQTYRPLEIVISDDASTDGSPELIQDYVAAHAPPDVTVIFNRNEKNLGILANWLKTASLSHGELIIMAGGDDISLSERTEKIVSAWLADGKRAVVISHAGYRIDSKGRSLGPLPAPSTNQPLGALMAWRRDCYTAFPPEPVSPRCVEDVPFAKRALMLGGDELVIPDRLVKYRLGSGLTSTLHHHRTPVIKSWRLLLSGLDQAEYDLAAIADSLLPERVEAFRKAFARERVFAENHLTLVESPSFRARWRALRKERMMGYWNSRVFMYAYLLPRRIGDWVLDTITRLNQLRRRLSR